MALFGVVFALGAGSAAAQITVDVPKTVDEGGRVTVKVTAKVSIPPAAAPTTVTVTVTPGAGTPSAGKMLSAGEDTDIRGGFEDVVEVELEVPNNDGTAAIKRTVSGTATLQTLPDDDAEDEAINLTFTVTDAGVTGDNGTDLLAAPDAKDLTIDDSDEQKFEWMVTPDKPKEDATITATLTANPAPVDLTYPTALLVDNTEYALDNTDHIFSVDGGVSGVGDGPAATIVITPPNPDGNREMDTIMLSAHVAGTTVDRTGARSIDVADIHMLPAGDKISAKAYMDDKGKKGKDEAMYIMEGGDPVHVTVTVDRGDDGYPMGEKLKVAVVGDAGQAMDYRVEGSPVEIANGTGKQTADFKLYALADEDIAMDEELMLNLVATGATAANGSGESMGMFKIKIKDATEARVSVKDDAYDAIMMALGDDPLNPGDMVELMTDDLFMVMDGYTASYSASVEGGAVSVSTSGEKIMVMAEDDGESKVTVTATATPMSGLVITQTVSNVAQLTFPVMVDLKMLEIMLSADDMNIVEGMSYEVMAKANRPVEKDTMVELVQTDGTASPSDYMVEPITIMAGEMMGSTMLMVEDDGMMENDGNATEMLTLEGRFADDQNSDGMKTNTVMFYLWDAAVPALPIIAQLLLAAFLALGGYRRYLRR